MRNEICSRPKVFTDEPTTVTFPTYGSSTTEKPCAIFTAWKTDLQHFPVQTGCLAVRWARGGQRFFESDRSQFAVDDSTYLVFNGGRAFSSWVESNTLVSCFCVAIPPHIAEDVLRTLITPADVLLDDPRREQYQPVQFFETAQAHNASIAPLLRRLEAAVESECEPHAWFAEQFQFLTSRLLHIHREAHRTIGRLPSVRQSTRLEIFRRVLQARDYIEAHLDQPLTIGDVASEACLSTFHFLRSFRQVLDETPHQYIMRRRLERARGLLEKTDMSVTRICTEVGFESLGSFSSLFRRHTSDSPERYRRRLRQDHRAANLVKTTNLSFSAEQLSRTG